MKSGFKRILILVIMIYGFVNLMNHLDLGVEGRNLKESILNLQYRDESVQADNINLETELVLVNNNNGLSADYKPENLSIPNILFTDEATKEEKHVAGIVIQPLEDLVAAAKNDGIILLGNSGYRSYKSQKDTYKNRVKSEGKAQADAYVAKPGFSEHQTGLCIDITNKDRYFVKGTKEADWLEENCYRFGFIIRYPYNKKNITGIEYEPWHIRYVGEKAAKYIYDNKITLEEYLGEE